MAPYKENKQDELMLMLLDKVSVAGSMVVTFAHHDNRTIPPFEVSTLHELGYCEAQNVA